MNCPKEASLMSMWLVQLAWIHVWCVMNKYISPYTRWTACVSCLFVLPSSGSAAAMVTQQRVVCSGTLRLESQHWRRTTGKIQGFWRNNRSNQFVRFQLLSFLLFSFGTRIPVRCAIEEGGMPAARHFDVLIAEYWIYSHSASECGGWEGCEDTDHVGMLRFGDLNVHLGNYLLM